MQETWVQSLGWEDPLDWASQVALAVKNPPANAGRHKKHEFDPWVRKIPWREGTHSSILVWRIPLTGVRQAAAHRVAWRRTQLKWLSTQANGEKNKGCEFRVLQLKHDPSTEKSYNNTNGSNSNSTGSKNLHLHSPYYKPGPVNTFTYTLFHFTTANEVGTIIISILHTGEMRQREGLGVHGTGFLHYAASVSGLKECCSQPWWHKLPTSLAIPLPEGFLSCMFKANRMVSKQRMFSCFFR